ncbi:hypothetical protein BUQ74_16535 [Leptospira weilii serovar Heyan]|nr:hypothetical protein BUQ74_16535 [Leptospira weilii serovar Heyan]QDK23144.1 hypothetical protein FHG67_10770 [Leptospira weilii]QDK27217.1 hypothetical protein FHG68_11480 [Leptospira weilii]
MLVDSAIHTESKKRRPTRRPVFLTEKSRVAFASGRLVRDDYLRMPRGKLKQNAHLRITFYLNVL